ncbi:uncharacterized protein FTOL_13862 [Fusarium torulosum]|uniref:Uncharacterized protein n=1 Tax=Fusarium torulosum TaxID=33205 RepID=A0AAE8SQ95_9HYPO|nr:uncharacterized protein FTOL_13862 [Fusarium torulosum]
MLIELLKGLAKVVIRRAHAASTPHGCLHPTVGAFCWVNQFHADEYGNYERRLE